MKKLALGLVMVALLGTKAPAYAGGVFKCVGPDGEMTFSFAPCAAAEPVEPQINQVRAIAPSRIDRAQLDLEIADLTKEIEFVKKEYEASLRQAGRDRTDELTDRFDKTTTSLLNDLQRKRATLAQR